jgi:D-sedoheptulose 7-phosphate isomerase
MEFFKTYFDSLATCVSLVNPHTLAEAAEAIKRTSSQGGKIIIVGNGGSAAISSHVAVDFIKMARVRAVNFNEADLITCLANDYGYENWVEKALEFYADAVDLIILISSSGKSKNILNGARRAKSMGLKVITFSGFDPENPLRGMGDLNFWAESSDYNFVEMAHHIWLVALSDKIAAERAQVQ